MHLYLSKILMSQRANFEIEENEAAGQSVVKYQIDKIVLTFKHDPPLPTHEGESLAQLQQELTQFVDQGLFQVGFQVTLALGKPGELQDVWVFNQIGRLHDLMSLLGQRSDPFLVSAQGQPLENNDRERG
jgi:hypothetical protein